MVGLILAVIFVFGVGTTVVFFLKSVATRPAVATLNKIDILRIPPDWFVVVSVPPSLFLRELICSLSFLFLFVRLLMVDAWVLTVASCFELVVASCLRTAFLLVTALAIFSR